jgi:hypothetical protein
MASAVPHRKNKPITLRLLAPSARRKPISRVRRTTALLLMRQMPVTASRMAYALQRAGITAEIAFFRSPNGTRSKRRSARFAPRCAAAFDCLRLG